MGKECRRLTSEDLEAMREELGLGLYHHERARDLDDELRQDLRVVRLGMSLRAWATARGVPLTYAGALWRYVERG